MIKARDKNEANSRISAPSSTLEPMSDQLLTLHMQCADPDCLYDNVLGKRVCDRCQKPLQYRYLWAIGESLNDIPAGTLVSDRYVVMSPQIWLETKPTRQAEVPILPDEALPYLHLYPQRLHVPGLYSFCLLENDSPVMLLDNQPIDPSGKLYPAIASAWTAATAVRQVHWLWQLLQLWTPLRQQGVATSLLIPDNLRVEGWRVRLCELIPDDVAPPPLKDLAAVWQSWVSHAQPLVREALQGFLKDMQMAEATQADLAAFGVSNTAPEGYVPLTLNAQLNQLLLEQAAQLPLRLEVAGASTTGPQREHNEDTCFPLSAPGSASETESDKLLSHLAIICDGIGGHEGGEVASQLALSSLKLQVGALLNEYASKTEPTAPAVIEQQLASIVRVANNLIAARNDLGDRDMRQRMGTTLVMAVQLPQSIALSPAAGTGKNAHELYLVNVGDSRAYWITPRYCHALTVDDDVVTREVSLGRQLYAEAIHRPDAGALTQALGTREGELLHPHVRRFVVDEDGLLLLCSDGLSDYDRVEQNWETHSRQVLRGEISLERAVQDWIDLANAQNGHDNTSVVMMRCRVTAGLEEAAPSTIPAAEPDLEEFTQSARALLDDEQGLEPDGASPAKPGLNPWLVTALSVMALMLGAMGLGLWTKLGTRSPQTPPVAEPQSLPASPSTLPAPQLPSAPTNANPPASPAQSN
jgi:protein phosphatase